MDKARVAIYTLTWERLEYTRYCFETLRSKAGFAYDHYVVDNGSTDGTVEWLKKNSSDFKQIMFLPENVGNAVGNNRAKNMICQNSYDYVIRMDNDCEVISDRIVAQMIAIMDGVRLYEGQYMLSPRVTGIVRQPMRARVEKMSTGYTLGIVGMLGGLFRMSPMRAFIGYEWPVDQNKIAGEESFGIWFRDVMGGKLAYVEDLVVNHHEGTDAQAVRYPEYHKRKTALQYMATSPDEIG